MLVMFAPALLLAQETVSPPTPSSLEKIDSKVYQVSEKKPAPRELASALASGDVPFFERFFSSGGSPDTFLPGTRKTLLMEAKSASLISFLLDSGADPTLRDERGATVLHHAVLHPDAAQIIPMLIGRGATVNAADKTGRTPLIAAVVNDRPDLVELLLSHGAQVQIETKEGQTALGWAEELGFIDIIEMLEAAQSGQ